MDGLSTIDFLGIGDILNIPSDNVQNNEIFLFGPFKGKKIEDVFNNRNQFKTLDKWLEQEQDTQNKITDERAKEQLWRVKNQMSDIRKRYKQRHQNQKHVPDKKNQTQINGMRNTRITPITENVVKEQTKPVQNPKRDVEQQPQARPVIKQAMKLQPKEIKRQEPLPVKKPENNKAEPRLQKQDVIKDKIKSLPSAKEAKDLFLKQDTKEMIDLLSKSPQLYATQIDKMVDLLNKNATPENAKELSEYFVAKTQQCFEKTDPEVLLSLYQKMNTKIRNIEEQQNTKVQDQIAKQPLNNTKMPKAINRMIELSMEKQLQKTELFAKYDLQNKKIYIDPDLAKQNIQLRGKENIKNLHRTENQTALSAAAEQIKIRSDKMNFKVYSERIAAAHQMQMVNRPAMADVLIIADPGKAQNNKINITIDEELNLIRNLSGEIKKQNEKEEPKNEREVLPENEEQAFTTWVIRTLMGQGNALEESDLEKAYQQDIGKSGFIDHDFEEEMLRDSIIQKRDDREEDRIDTRSQHRYVPVELDEQGEDFERKRY